MRRACPLALLLALSGAGAAADAPDPVFDHPAPAAQLSGLLGTSVSALGQAAAVRGDFSQRKILRELPQPLVSSGDFLVARGLGVAWHTRVPFDSELILTPQALVQREGGGQATRMDASSQPGLEAVEQVFGALFALDLPRLSERFELYGQRSGSRWTLGLKPREAALSQVVTAVVISGEAQPQKIVLHEANGDRTEIVLSRQSLLPALSEAERRHLQ